MTAMAYQGFHNGEGSQRVCQDYSERRLKSPSGVLRAKPRGGSADEVH